MTVRVGVYPGSFNPPTVAHLAIAEAARVAGRLDRVDLVVSEVALGKEDVTIPTVADRIEVLRQVVARRPHLGVRTTSSQLLVDIAEGADAVVVGADKWGQVVDPVWYGGSAAARDQARSRLPLVLLVPRPPSALPPEEPGRLIVVQVDPSNLEISSTAARAGRHEWMLPEAVAFDERTGAWSDTGRYRASHHRHSTGG